MIHKIEKLTSIGLFKAFRAVGDIAFKPLTLLYAENGSGKTTLTAVFRSLKEGDPSIVAKRVSKGASSPQEAVIKQRDIAGKESTHTYRPDRWSNPFTDIEIFDIYFINDNIYSGFDFSEDHKRHLHQFVLGAQGVQIKQQIETNKQARATNLQTIQAAQEELIARVGNGLDQSGLQDFLKLPNSEDPDLDRKIAEAKSQLTKARNSLAIQGFAQLKAIEFMPVPFEGTVLCADLKMSLPAIQEAALESVLQEHCSELKNNTIQSPEAWLRTGFSYVQSKKQASPGEQGETINCPFCLQPIKDSQPILRAYAQKFNDAFIALIARMQAHHESLNKFSIDAWIQYFQQANQENMEHHKQWHLFLKIEAPDLIFQPDEKDLQAQIKAVIVSVSEKLRSPSIEVDTSSTLTFLSSVKILNTNISNCNVAIKVYNDTAISFKATIPTVPAAEDTLQRLTRIKLRYDTENQKLVAQIVADYQRRAQLKALGDSLIEQEKQSALSLFASYSARINYYLDDVFHTPFRIQDFQHITPRGRAISSKIGYELTIFGDPIEFNTDMPNSVKECLSEGDKSTIALAFFLAKMDVDSDLSRKVIIFDDPISSFDQNRRFTTVSLLRHLSERVEQLVVLSHNAHFLHDLIKNVAKGDRKTLIITNNIETSISEIKELDLEALIEPEYFSNIRVLEGFQINPAISQKEIVLGLIRNILESHIRFKFYRQLAGIPSEQRTFGTMIIKLEQQNTIFRDDSDRDGVFSKLRLLNAISLKPHHGEPDPDYNALGVNPDSISVRELSIFVTETLGLIDNIL